MQDFPAQIVLRHALSASAIPLMVTFMLQRARTVCWIVDGSRLYVVTFIALLLVLASCDQASGRPAQWIVGVRDTLIVNNWKPVRIPSRVMDAAGRDIPGAAPRYQWVAGDTFAITKEGVVHCARSGDAILRASLRTVVKTVILHCRPVRQLRSTASMQLIVGDTSQPLPIEAIDMDDKPVRMLTGSVSTMRDSVVAIEPGLRVSARVGGASLTTVYVGDLHVRVGVHTYERVQRLDSLRVNQRPTIVRLQLASGERKRWHLPAGVWMFTMLPYDDEATGLRLRVQNANCAPLLITRRRHSCVVMGNDGAVVVSNPGRAEVLVGELLVEREHN